MEEIQGIFKPQERNTTMKLQLLKENFENFLKALNENLFSKIKVEPLRIVKNLEASEEDELNELDFRGQEIGTTFAPDDIKRNLATIEKDGFKVSSRGKIVPIHKQKIIGKSGGDVMIDKETGKQKLDKQGNVKLTKAIAGIKDENNGEYDLDKLRDMIIARPDHLLSKNEKMQHGDDLAVQFFNIGLPALMAVVYDETKKEFVKVSTCPGAGTCIAICYALAGNYIMVPDSQMYRTKCLNWLLNDPDGFAAKLIQEISTKEKNGRSAGIEIRIRWHDAGDFFSDAYAEVAWQVARACPKVKFYAYTKMAGVVQSSSKPSNFLVRFSMGATKKETGKIISGDFNSYIVATELFKDLFIPAKNGKAKADPITKLWSYKSNDGEELLKQRIAQKYNLDINSVLSYDNFMDNRNSDTNSEKRYNVIIRPGQSDFPASEDSVLAVYNLQH